MQIAFAGGDKRLGIPSMPRKSIGFDSELLKRIRGNMVPLVSNPKWNHEKEGSGELDFRRVSLLIGHMVGRSASLYMPSSFCSDGTFTYFWRGLKDDPVMGYAIHQESKMRYKWRLDEFGFTEFMENPGSDNLMFEADSEMGRKSAESLARRVIKKTDKAEGEDE